MNSRKRKEYCIIRNCPNFCGSLDKDARFFRAPSAISDPERRAKWIDVIKQIQEFGNIHGQICVCYRHFEQKDIINMKTAVPSIFDSAKEISGNCIDEASGGSFQSKDTDFDNHHCTCDETELLLLKIKKYENINSELEIAKLKLIMSGTKMKAAYEKQLQKSHRLSKELKAAKGKIEKLEYEITNGKTVSGENSDIENTAELQEIVDCLCKGHIGSGSKYSETIRLFCLTLHFLSPRAYRFVRAKFLNRVPHGSTIAKWYQNSDLDSQPGISQNALNVLKAKATSRRDNGKCPLICSIVFDEMKLKKLMEWCPKTESYFGLMNKSENDDSEELSMITDAIVFMVCGVNEFFKMPISFHFIQSLNASERAKLVKELIKEITEAGIEISNLTFDGLAANVAMCEIFGCSFKGEIKPFFLNPVNKRPIHIIFDPSHMLKLARNTLGNRETLYDNKNHKIEWRYIIELEKVSRNSIFGHTHKITKRHIQWKSREMHVRTAAETLSNSTADALEFLMNNSVEKFSSASETITFIRTINDIFDIMNSMQVNNNEQHSFKNAINLENHAEVFEFFKYAKSYLMSLQIMIPESRKRQKLIDSKVRTGFRGFLINIISISSMYKDYVEETHWMLFFATYRLSQDHLEMFFGRVRMANGLNDNPTCKQFISAYRKLGLQADFSISKKSNITLREGDQCSSNILTVSSSKKQKTSELGREPDEPSPNVDDSVLTPQFLCSENDFETTDIAGIVYIANRIEQKLLKSDQIHCLRCRDVLVANDKVSANMCLMTNGSKPCHSTFRLCKIIEFISHRYRKKSGDLVKNFKSSIINATLSEIDIDDLFPSGFDADHPIEHRHFLVKFIMDNYLHIRNTHNARDLNMSTENEYLRSKLKKDIHRLGQ